MSIENIIRSWKADEEDQNTEVTANPAGEELSDQELAEIAGGMPCPVWGTCILNPATN